MPEVMRLKDLSPTAMNEHFQPFGLSVVLVADGDPIPGSHWGDEEAGLIQNELFVRTDTPVHSALHEGGHWLVMPVHRRTQLHTNAGGTLAEENAVCYLQVLMADYIPNFSRSRLFTDMDAWGYSFRLGSAKQWFEQDANDALVWLETQCPKLLSAFHDQ